MPEKVLIEESLFAPATTSNDDLLDIDEMEVNSQETNDEEEINLSKPDPYLRDMTFCFILLSYRAISCNLSRDKLTNYRAIIFSFIAR